MTFRGGIVPEGARFVVWFDHPRDCLCFASRIGLEEGEQIPEERIVRIPLKLGEDFIETAMNAATSAAMMAEGEADFDKVMYGIQELLDLRMVDAIELASEFRAQRSKQAGGGVIDTCNKMMSVNADEFANLVRLRDRLNGPGLPEDFRDELFEKGLL